MPVVVGSALFAAMSSRLAQSLDKKTLNAEESCMSDDCGHTGLLPDPTVEPSAQPQPPDKACQRCQQNGIDCIVSTQLSYLILDRN